MSQYRHETVTVCQINGQWGILFECGDFVTEYWHTAHSTCRITECTGRTYARGLCRKHYMRIWGGRTNRSPVVRARASRRFADRQDVLDVVERIKCTYLADYGDELPWRIEVLDE